MGGGGIGIHSRQVGEDRPVAVRPGLALVVRLFAGHVDRPFQGGEAFVQPPTVGAELGQMHAAVGIG